MKHLKLYEEFGDGGTHFYKFTLDSVSFRDKKQLQNWQSVFETLKESDPSAEIIKSKSGEVFLNVDLGMEASMNNEVAIATFFKSSMEKSEVEPIIVSAYKNLKMQLTPEPARVVYAYSLTKVDEKSMLHQLRH